jgi:hypothetical protein
VHHNDNLGEFWHKMMGHVHHKVLPILREIVIGIPEFRVEQRDVYRAVLKKSVIFRDFLKKSRLLPQPTFSP